MTTEAITSWLRVPAALPDAATIDAVLRTWPWFTPVRLMEAAREHSASPFSDKTLTALRLYGSEWQPAYDLLLEKQTIDVTAENIGEEETISVREPELTDEDLYEHPEVMEFEEAVIQTDSSALIQPLYAEDYFRHQGIEAVPEDPEAYMESDAEPQTLMVVMSFAEWLTHFKTKTQKEKEEAQEKSALRSMWQQEKLAAAMEDEPEEIPEDVFEMAVTSITREDDIISEPLAQIYERQEKWNAAADMYRKLALKYPAKSTYFAGRADAVKKRLL